MLCSRLSCSGLKSTGLLGGCRPSRRSYWVGVGLVGVAFSGPSLRCLNIFFLLWA